MKVICKKCNVDFDGGGKSKFFCPSCGEQYDLKSKSETFMVKTLNGVTIGDLSFDDVKNGVSAGKFLSVDFVSGSGTPFTKIKDSEFGKFGIETAQVFEKKSGSWSLFFVLSLVVNILLLVFIYMQKIKIDSIMGR